MFYISENEYNSKMKKIKAKNKSLERSLALKKEKNKIKRFTFPKVKTSNKVLLVAIIAVILFSVACLYIQYTTSTEVSSTLITLWFSFWTVEIVSLAGIKVSKVKKSYSILDSNENDELNMDDNTVG